MKLFFNYSVDCELPANTDYTEAVALFVIPESVIPLGRPTTNQLAGDVNVRGAGMLDDGWQEVDLVCLGQCELATPF